MYLEELAHRIRQLIPNEIDVPSDSEDLFLIYAVLARAKGQATTSEDVHDAWAAWQVARDPSHAALVPYAELPAETRSEDTPFLTAIRKASG